MHTLALGATHARSWFMAAFLAATVVVILTASAEGAPAPSIASISPATGPMAGGTATVITGTGFVAGATVDFGGVPGTVTSVTATQINVTTAAHAPADVIVTVTNLDGQSATISGAFRYLGPPPTLTAVAPATGPTTGATTITLTGTEFASGASVTVGGRAATNVTVTSSTSATASTPWGVVGPADVVYTNADGQSATLPAAFTYTQAAPPTVSALSPSSGTNGGGTVVTLTGTGFAPGAAVRFGATAATNVAYLSPTSIRATAPAGTVDQVVSVTVTNPDSQTATRANAYTYASAAAPVVTSVSPSVGGEAGGTVVLITGANFNPGLSVTFGAAPGVVSSVTPTRITAIAPAQASATKVDITVTNTDGKTAKLTGAFTYQKGPTLTKVAPATGSSAGGRTITLMGTNFLAGMTVLVNGNPATDVEVTSTSAATAVTPPGWGIATVTVRNPDGQAHTLANAFQYLLPPSVVEVTPLTGPDTGGTSIVITGTGFGAGAKVFVGDEEATEVNVVSATRITAVTPEASVSGLVDTARVTVVMPGELASVEAVDFVYRATTGRITSGEIPERGFGLIVFSGGSSSLLVATAMAEGCSDLERLSFFAADGRGVFVAYIPSAPPFVNAAWLDLFPSGLPAGQPLVARCA